MMGFLRTICYLAFVLLFMFLAGCGSSSSSRSSGAFITGGIAVDPNIVGATFFEDVNDNGRWDQGEQISTVSDEDGTFTFASPVPAGRTIIMHDRGTHNGLKFTGVLARKILNSDAGLVVVSPLTTLQALGLSPAEIVDLLQESIPALDESHVTADPYASLNLFKEGMAIDDASIAGIRANVLVSVLFQLSQPMGSWLNISEGELERLLSGLYFDADQQASIVEAVRYALHPDALTRIRNAMPLSDPDVTVTMRDVADTVPAITSWWLQKYLYIILEDIWSGVGLGELTEQIDQVQGDLGYHYVKKNNADSFPEFSGDHVYLAEDETVVDESLSFTSALVSDKAFSIGEALLLFDNDGTLQIITSSDSDSSSEAEIEDARWEIDANGDLLLSASQDESSLAQISLIADWSSHIHIQVQGPMADEDAYIMNLPLAKAQPFNELIGSHFVIEDNQFADSGTITGGHLYLDDVLGDGILIYYPDGDEEITFDWSIDKYNGLVVDTIDQIDTIYHFNSNGTNTLMLSEYDEITELEDELKLYRPLLLTQQDITAARFYSGASGYIESEYTEFSIEFSDIEGNRTYRWTKSSLEEGTWTYDEATGRLELSPTSGAGDISTRTIWFVLFEEEKKGFFDEEPQDVYRYFMENRDADALISSSFGEWNRAISPGDR